MKRLSQAGDTIVEVLIAIGIIGLVLVTGYQTTNRNVQTIQDAQEHSQAAKLAQTQLELVRAKGPDAAQHCLSKMDSTTVPTYNDATNPLHPCTVDGSNVRITTSVQPAYNLAISQSGNTYTVAVTWYAINGDHDNVTLYYAQPSN